MYQSHQYRDQTDPRAFNFDTDFQIEPLIG